MVERERLRRLQCEAGAACDLGHDGVQPVVVDGVLEACALAHRTVAEVALRGDHRSGDIQQLFAGHEADHVGHARPGLGIAVRGAHAATDADVVAQQLPIAQDSDKAQIVGEHVHIVERRCGETDLEFAR